MENINQYNYKRFGILVYDNIDNDIIIKKHCRDFLVIEKIKNKNCINLYSNQTWFWVKILKKCIEHFKLINLFKKINKKVYYLGIKDKYTYSIQYLSINSDKLNLPKLNELKILEYKKCNIPLKRNDLLGNLFYVWVYSKYKDYDLNGFPNFYGYQRFGKDNLDLSLLYFKNKKEFFEVLSKLYNKSIKTKKDLIRFLGKDRVELMFQSIQAYVFNYTLSKLIINEEKIPKNLYLIGKNLNLNKNLHYFEYIREIIKEYSINLKELPYKKSIRLTRIYPKDLKIWNFKDKIFIKVYLPKGSYFTIFLASIYLFNIKYKEVWNMKTKN